MSIIQPNRIGCGDDITTMSADTTTVIETKKRAYERKDYGDTNTPTVMEKRIRDYKRKDRHDTDTSNVMETKKRACKRIDCGDTNTPAVMEKKKKACKRKDCGDTNTPAVLEKKKRACRRKTYLPHDIIVEEILTRVPVPTLLISVRVSKLWYKSIHNDHKRLTYSHFLQSQKQPQVILRLSNVRAAVDTKTGDANYGCHFFKITTGLYSHDNVLRFEKFRTALTQPYMGTGWLL
ncbi:hypothetical protein MKW92_028071 [Papaver armeniacum]|nr:hypothetical protein MKW92_028071 [Papaver armeniacum]